MIHLRVGRTQNVLVGFEGEFLSGAAAIEACDPHIFELTAGVNVLTLEEAAEPGTAVHGILSLAHAPVTAELLERVGSDELKIVSNLGSGVDHIDLAELKRLGVPVANLRALPELTEATADCAMALLLAAGR